MIKNGGITLIPLIITIIITLIIAGITVSLVTGDNGLLTKASEVEYRFSKAEIKEALAIEINSQLVEASNSISGTTNDISQYFNEESMINYLDTVIDCLDPEEGITAEVIPVLTENASLYKRYIIKPLKLSSSVDVYGKGTVDSDHPDDLNDLFVLEVEYDTTTKKSTGKYELKYYNYDGESELIDTYNFYITNQG